MLTFFTTAKAFRGHTAIIQRNALESWTRLEPRPEILLFGNDDGSADIARELGLRHVPQIAVNEYGTPLIGDIFEQAQRLASHRIVCYVNADILLLPDFMQALTEVAAKKRTFLMVGERCDVDVDDPIDFAAADWRERLRRLAAASGKSGGPRAIDYFAFPKGALGPIPPFAIGRWVWDNWLMYQARRRHVPLVDATQAILCLHQTHDYGHVKVTTGASAWDWPETKTNLQLAGGVWSMNEMEDATHVLSDRSGTLVLKRRYSARHIRRPLEAMYHTNPMIGAVRAAARAVRRLVTVARG